MYLWEERFDINLMFTMNVYDDLDQELRVKEM